MRLDLAGAHSPRVHGDGSGHRTPQTVSGLWLRSAAGNCLADPVALPTPVHQNLPSASCGYFRYDCFRCCPNFPPSVTAGRKIFRPHAIGLQCPSSCAPIHFKKGQTDICGSGTFDHLRTKAQTTQHSCITKQGRL